MLNNNVSNRIFCKDSRKTMSIKNLNNKQVVATYTCRYIVAPFSIAIICSTVYDRKIADQYVNTKTL